MHEEPVLGFFSWLGCRHPATEGAGEASESGRAQWCESGVNHLEAMGVQ